MRSVRAASMSSCGLTARLKECTDGGRECEEDERACATGAFQLVNAASRAPPPSLPPTRRARAATSLGGGAKRLVQIHVASEGMRKSLKCSRSCMSSEGVDGRKLGRSSLFWLFQADKRRSCTCGHCRTSKQATASRNGVGKEEGAEGSDRRLKPNARGSIPSLPAPTSWQASGGRHS